MKETADQSLLRSRRRELHERTARVLEERFREGQEIQPETLGQASRISGVSPADLSVLMVLLKKNGGGPKRDVSRETYSFAGAKE